jgi:hypothetical protein
MTDTPTLVKPSAGAPDGPDLELELKRRPKWPWIVGGVVAAAAIAAVLIVPRLGGTATANETPGATLYITTVKGQPTETALIEFVAEEVAPKYGIEVAFRGLADSTTLNRAVSEGEVAGTIYQHKLWLGQVLEANPDFQLEAATPVFRWGFGLWSDRWESVDELPQGATVSLYSDPANEHPEARRRLPGPGRPGVARHERDAAQHPAASRRLLSRRIDRGPGDIRLPGRGASAGPWVHPRAKLEACC